MPRIYTLTNLLICIHVICIALLDRQAKNLNSFSHIYFNSRIRINVSGKKYELYEHLVANFSNTLLGNGAERAEYYDSKRDEYFFDRNREAFEGIAQFYQTYGEFHVPHFLPAEIFYEEIKFFGLDQYLSSECDCDIELLTLAVEERYAKIKAKYEMACSKAEKKSTKKEITDLKKKFSTVNYFYDIEDDPDESTLPANKYQRFMWLLFEKPNSTWLGSVIAFICLSTIVVSIFSMCMETAWRSDARDQDDIFTRKKNSSDLLIQFSDKEEFSFFPDVRLKAFYIIEFICNTIFTLEIIIRTLASPSKVDFFKR